MKNRVTLTIAICSAVFGITGLLVFIMSMTEINKNGFWYSASDLATIKHFMWFGFILAVGGFTCSIQTFRKMLKNKNNSDKADGISDHHTDSKEDK